MNTLTIEDVIEMGGNEWSKGDMKRVYISQDLFNALTGFGLRLNATKWKFYVDVKSGDMFRTSGKKQVLEANISEIKVA